MTESHVIEGQGIENYRLIATLKGLELEVKWGAMASPLTRGMALASARRIKQQYEVPGRPWRTRKQALAGMQQLCEQLGLTHNEENTSDH